MDLIRNCQFSAVEADTVVIRQGETGDRYTETSVSVEALPLVTLLW